MNLLEEKMISTLIDLKENYGALGLKAEFEAEGTKFEEAIRLKEIATRAGLDLSIKIGGCEAVKDMYDAKEIGATSIIAPMIESPYAAKKYLQAAKNVFSPKEQGKVKFLINIETKYGFEYLNEILESDYSKNLTGIVFGRTDMAGSLDLDVDDVNNDIIFEYAQKIAHITKKYGKEFVIGGGVTHSSVEFFKKIPNNSLDRFETRKIIFNAQSALKNENIQKGILEALEFEIMWLKDKQEYCKTTTKEDKARLRILETRCAS